MGKQFLSRLTGNTPGENPLGLTANTPTGGGLFSKFSNKEILAGANSGLSALSSIVAGKLKEESSLIDAEQRDVAAENIRQLGVSQEQNIRSSFTEAQSQVVASLAASGIKGGATVQATVDTLQRREEGAVVGVRTTAEINALSKDIEAVRLRQRAGLERIEGQLGAFGELGSFAKRFAGRGRL